MVSNFTRGALAGAALVALAGCIPQAGDSPAGQIPASLHGHWGLVEKDCDLDRDDNKGLMVVGPDSLTFYESRAVPAPGLQVGADEVAGQFNFTGEGQSWTRNLRLRVENGGAILIREDRGREAQRAPLRYLNCNWV